jgi:hypothetical protein
MAWHAHDFSADWVDHDGSNLNNLNPSAPPSGRMLEGGVAGLGSGSGLEARLRRLPPASSVDTTANSGIFIHAPPIPRVTPKRL